METDLALRMRMRKKRRYDSMVEDADRVKDECILRERFNAFTAQVILRHGSLQEFMEMSHEERMKRFHDIASEKALIGIPVQVAPLTRAISATSDPSLRVKG